MARVLVADADRPCREALCRRLSVEGLGVTAAADGPSLLACLQQRLPHAIVLDPELPGGGSALCEAIKDLGDVPIVVLTAVEDERLKVEALRSYADDYIPKSASLDEVAARLVCVLRRTWLCCLDQGATYRADEQLRVDFARHEALGRSGVHHLTPLETRLLRLLAANAGRVLPYELLLERLWGDPRCPPNSLWEHVRRIRRKIGDDPARPRYIVNEPGVGYRFCASPSIAPQTGAADRPRAGGRGPTA